MGSVYHTKKMKLQMKLCKTGLSKVLDAAYVCTFV